MAPVQSRLVLAVTIPAAALAIFLSLFWLRRASKGHPPSPPDIPDKKIKDEQTSEDICETEPLETGVIETDISKDFAKSSSSESVDNFILNESTSDFTFIGSPLSLKSVLSTKIDIQPCEEVKVHDISAVHVEVCPVKKGVCFAIETEEAKAVNLEASFACGDKLTSEKETLDIVIVKTGSEENITISPDEIKTVETPNIKSSEEETVLPVSELEEAVVAIKNTQQIESVPPEQAVPDIKSVQEPSTTTKMITEETASPIKLDYHKETDVEKSDLSEKLANLELDTMKLGDVDVKERDSANHSPSENMLASPSMSNFSDAHSEGSSDSGKGHSDGTTSPSRTPAGGSSVSGDPSPSIYEFVIPQIIVGRLIGRHGVFLHEIMSETHTSIFIKVHPETVKLKICAIEGSQQDIDKALEKIRKKFPLRRYPKLTLERVSFVPMQSGQQLRAEDFHLQLIEGVNNDVILSSLLNPGQFFVQQPCHPSYPCLTPLTQTLTQAYSTTDAPPLVSPVSDAICVCPSLGGWYRAQIVSVDEDARHCDIKFVDYGGYLRVEAALLKQIRADFLMLPFQAVECSLANVQPIHETGWSEEARLFVHNITFGLILQAQIVSYTETGIPLVNLYTGINNQVVLVNAELVSNGFATFISTPDNSEDINETKPDQVMV